MWSYKDIHGNVHLALEVEEIRLRIETGEINKSTFLKNSHFGTWVIAENTLFFDLPTNELPKKLTKKHQSLTEERELFPTIENALSSTRAKPKYLHGYLIILFLTLLATVPLIFVAFKAYKAESSIKEIQSIILNNEDYLKEKDTVTSRLVEIEEKLALLHYTTPSSSVSSQELDATIANTKNKRDQINNTL
ncbi:hypothetical protein OAB00_02095, partial [Akkermansiaceae bacterium]|nr:hypothetical protein [Akkermansiaceae bacterium]